jgi:hypothetical protein
MHGLEEERDRGGGTHRVGHRHLVHLAGADAETPVVPRQPQQPIVGDVGDDHHQLVGPLRRQRAARVVLPGDLEVAPGPHAGVAELAGHPVVQPVALVDALVQADLEPGAEPAEAGQGAAVLELAIVELPHDPLELGRRDASGCQ